MTVRDVQVRAGWIVDQRRVACDCGRIGRHERDCRFEVAWERAVRQAASQLEREERRRRVAFARAV